MQRWEWSQRSLGIGAIALLAALLAAAAVAGPARAVEPADVSARVRGADVRVRTQAVDLRVQRRPVRMRVRLAQGEVLLRDRRSGGLFYERGGAVHGLERVVAAAELPDGVRLDVVTDEGLPARVVLRFLTRRTLEVRFEPPRPESVEAFGSRIDSPEKEAVYGLTERLADFPPFLPGISPVPIDEVHPPEVGSLDRRGETVEMRVTPTFSLYAPFFQTSGGYGLSVAGTTLGRFDLAATRPRTLRFRFEPGTTPERGALVFHVFAGPDHATILDEYTHHTGRPFVPPDWAFRNWRWRDELEKGPTAPLDGVRVNAQVAEDVRMFERFGIPPGVYLFDRPVLEGNFGFARFEWDEERLPNPEAMLASLRRRGYELATWSSTWTCGSEPGTNGRSAFERGYLAPGPEGGPPHCSNFATTSFVLDVTNPAARAWWRDRVAAFMAEHGIKGIKLDRGEEHIPSEADDVWHDGRTGREVRNAYPVLQAGIHHDALASAFPDDFLVLARPGYTGAQQFAIFWGGDTPGSELFGAGPGTDLGLRTAIIAQQRAAFMGFPIWGSDTGGYYQFKDRDVFARWIELSAFSGIMEIGGKGTHAPWDMPTEPRFDPEMIGIYRRYTRLRETLLPYIVAAAEEAAQGLPIVRPMPFADRNDPHLKDLWDQYLFGPDFLVAPVWRTGARSREVYLPRGAWRSYWDRSEVHRGPRRIRVDVPLDEIPVFVREGASVPGP